MWVICLVPSKGRDRSSPPPTSRSHHSQVLHASSVAPYQVLRRARSFPLDHDPRAISDVPTAFTGSV